MGCSDFFDPIVEIDIPEEKPKLAMYSLIADGEQEVSLFLTHSRHPLGVNSYPRRVDSSVFVRTNPGTKDTVRSVFYYVREWPDTVSNATVGLYQQNALVATLKYTTSGYYTGNVLTPGIKAGNSYTIKIEAPGFDPIESTINVPIPVPVDTVIYRPDIKQVGSGLDLTTFNTDEYIMKWTDPSATKNYYESDAFHRDSLRPQYIHLFGINDLSHTRFLDDEGTNGKSIEWTRHAEVNKKSGQFNAVYVRLYSISESYYSFQISVERMFNNRDNPFSEPSIMYTNVKNGYGYFGAYSFTEKLVKLQ